MNVSDRNQVLVSSSNDYRKVIYLMTKSFRIKNNYGLYQSVEYAKRHDCSLSVIIVEPYEINQRNLDFFQSHLPDLMLKLKTYTSEVSFLKRDQDMSSFINEVHTIFMDKAYLKFDKDFVNEVKRYCYKLESILIEVESNVCVPVGVASNKEEYSARTIRPKILNRLDQFSQTVLMDSDISSGEVEAFDIYHQFKNYRLIHYDEHNDPSKHLTSGLSPYLKYGMISPVVIYLDLKDNQTENAKSFLEELIVRRELAYNYIYYNLNYDDFYSITDAWAYQTMKNHIDDPREYLYTKEDYINFNTHDIYFNAAMKEMVYLGKMHSYMRMYWCKKIIEWSKSYEEAYHIAIDLNNYYFLDGLTPNGYTGVAWCFGKHDRAWFERDIFGKLRYMNDNGLKRKFDIDRYVDEMNRIERV